MPARLSALLCVLVLAAGCNGESDDFGEPDPQTLREAANCGQAMDPHAPPPGTYIDQGQALDYERMVPRDAPNNGDGAYFRQILHDPPSLEQLYFDAVRGENRARWVACHYEVGSRGAARRAAERLAGLRCQTIASCEFRPDKLPYSDATASGIRMLTVIADEFEAESRRLQLIQEIVGHALTLFVGTRALSARAAARPATMTRPTPAPAGASGTRAASAGATTSPGASATGTSGQAAGKPALRELTAAELAGVRGAGPTRYFDSFRAFKRQMGPAGSGKEWHHIVEKHEGNVKRFGAREIHNTSNIIPIDAEIHRKVSAHYSSVAEASKPLTVRKWLSTKSFDEQRAYGIDMLRKLGAIP